MSSGQSRIDSEGTSPGLVKEEVNLKNPRLILVGDSQSGPTFCTTRGKHFPSVLGSHSRAESVFVFSLSVRGLKCTFHMIILFIAFYIIYGLQN